MREEGVEEEVVIRLQDRRAIERKKSVTGGRGDVVVELIPL